jgi:hypothetical protein
MLYVYMLDGKAELPKPVAPPNNNKGKQQDQGKGPAPLPGGPAPEQQN